MNPFQLILSKYLILKSAVVYSAAAHPVYVGVVASSFRKKSAEGGQNLQCAGFILSGR